jgi:hypothetical protein
MRSRRQLHNHRAKDWRLVSDRPKKQRSALSMLIAITVLLAPLVGILVNRSASSADAASTPEAITSEPTPSGIEVSYPIQLPTGYETPTAILGTAEGLWAFAQGIQNGSPAESLFYWSDSSSKLTTYPINTSNISGLRAGINTPIVLDNSGNVWLGLNSTLVELDPTSGTTSVLPLPDVSTGSSGSGLPNLDPAAQAAGVTPGKLAGVEALANGPGGSIVVGRFGSTELQFVNPTTLAISDAALPNNTVLIGQGVTDLASNSDGTDVAAALYNGDGTHELGQYVRGGWTVQTTSCAANTVSEVNGQLVVGGPSCVEETSVGGDATSAATLSSITATGLGQASWGISTSSSSLIVCLPQDMALISGMGQTDFSLGTSIPGPSVGSPAVSNSQVNVEPLALTTGGPNMTWFVPDAGQNATIGLIST